MKDKKTLKRIKWTNNKAGDVLATVEAEDFDYPYDKLTYALPRYNNDLWGLVDVNSTSGEIIMRKELEKEKRMVVSLVC